MSENGMQQRTIRRALKKKIDEWLETIPNEDLRKAMAKEVIVTGGSIASMLLGERITDYDIYFRTLETTQKVAEYYVVEFLKLNPGYTPVPEVKVQDIPNLKGETERRVVIWVQSAGVVGENPDDESTEYQYFEMTDNVEGDQAAEYAEQILEESKDESLPKFRPVFMSQNAITLSDKMQVVIRFYGEPDKIHDNYDFVHAMSYYDYAQDKLETNAEVLDSLRTKRLRYVGSLYPIATLFRIRKFMQRGWHISAGEILKVAWQISEIDLKDYRTAREQLTGVDAAYFAEVLHIMQDRHPDKEVDSTYVATIIDRVFNT